MSLQVIKLSTEEMTNLDTLFRKAKKRVIITTIMVFIVFFILSLIPEKILDLFSTNTHVERENPDQNAIQSWGFSTWLIVFLLLNALFIVMAIIGNKIFPLKKDMQEGEKMKVDVVVTKKFADTKTDNYSMQVSSDSWKSKKIILERDQYNQFAEGQKLVIDIYKNSLMLVSRSI
jgi:ABC-type multidrug transport system fused ATPase/permease subunit